MTSGANTPQIAQTEIADFPWMAAARPAWRIGEASHSLPTRDASPRL